MTKLLSILLLLAATSLVSAQPGCQSFYAQLRKTGKHKRLVAAIDRAGLAKFYSAKKLAGTFFAPTDKAIAFASKKFGADFNQIPAIYLPVLFDYHRSPRVIEKKNFKNGLTIPTATPLFPTYKMIVNSKGVFLKTPVNVAKITTANAAYTCRGVIHFLDAEPLIPTTL